jgi:Tol biopolymer transport system component
LQQLTFNRTQDGFATWSPDGKFIVYSCIAIKDSNSKTGLWKISFEDNKAEQIFNEIAEHPKWSPDGRLIVFDADSGNSMRMIPAEGGSPLNFLPDTIEIYNGGMPCWSPDGIQIAFLERKGKSICIYNM